MSLIQNTDRYNFETNTSTLYIAREQLTTMRSHDQDLSDDNTSEGLSENLSFEADEEISLKLPIVTSKHGSKPLHVGLSKVATCPSEESSSGECTR